MKIRYTKHAKERMRARNISKAEVVLALQIGRKREVSGDLRKAVHLTSGNILTVIYVIKASDMVEIITAYRQQP